MTDEAQGQVNLEGEEVGTGLERDRVERAHEVFEDDHFELKLTAPRWERFQEADPGEARPMLEKWGRPKREATRIPENAWSEFIEGVLVELRTDPPGGLE